MQCSVIIERERERACNAGPRKHQQQRRKEADSDGFDRTALLFVGFASCIERVDAVMILLSPDILADVI
jgi:hypothetical protein